MNVHEIRDAVVKALHSVAPEFDPRSLRDTDRLRDELDLDSMDFLNFVVALHQLLRVDIPEADYPHLQTLESTVNFLAARLQANAAKQA